MVMELPLTKGQVALIDDDDFDEVAHLRWNAYWDPRAKTFYARRGETVAVGQQVTIRLHRFLLSAPKGVLVDHINHDGLDNRRSNLRLATHQENCRNRRRRHDAGSGFKGVTPNKPGWSAYLRIDGQGIFLGYFRDPVEAAKAYDRAAIERYGAFAFTNFPVES